MTVEYPLRTSDLQMEITRAQERAKLEVLERQNERLTSQLAAIFDGIGRGEQVELTYPDGQTIPITRARKRNVGDPE